MDKQERLKKEFTQALNNLYSVTKGCNISPELFEYMKSETERYVKVGLIPAVIGYEKEGE